MYLYKISPYGLPGPEFPSHRFLDEGTWKAEGQGLGEGGVSGSEFYKEVTGTERHL